MAHKKGQGSSRNGRESQSKRLGVKIYSGQHAIPGNILVRQRGTQFYPGANVGMGKDHTIFAKIEGIVTFVTKKNNKKYISVIPAEAMLEETAATKPAKKAKKVEADVVAKVEAPKEETAVAKTKAPKEEKKAAAKKADKKGDDLKKINGIGPAFQKRLNAMGIFTYADMAAITTEKAEALEAEYNDAMTSPEEWINWANEAKELMK